MSNKQEGWDDDGCSRSAQNQKPVSKAQELAARTPALRGGDWADEAAAELRRLEAEVERWTDEWTIQAAHNAVLTADKAELLEALKDATYQLEKSRIWGGMEWVYHPLLPHRYLPLRDKFRALVEKHGGGA